MLVAALLAVAIACGTHFQPALGAEPTPRFLLQWGRHGTANGEFDFPIGITINPADEVFVTDFYNSRVQKFSADGKFLAAFPVSPFPGGIEIDRDGNLYIAHSGIPPSKYEAPRQRDKIAVFDASGKLLREWGKFGSGDGEFDLPGGIVIRDDRVYVADQCNRRIQVFDRQGTFLSKWGSKGFEVGQFGGNPHPKAFFAGPTFLACDQQGNIFTTEAPLCRIQKFSSEGVPLAAWGSTDPGPGKFGDYFTAFDKHNMRGPTGLCFDAQGRLWANGIGGRIQQFTESGEFLMGFGEEGTGLGQFYAPTAWQLTATAVSTSWMPSIIASRSSKCRVDLRPRWLTRATAANKIATSLQLNRVAARANCDQLHCFVPPGAVGLLGRCAGDFRSHFRGGDCQSPGAEESLRHFQLDAGLAIELVACEPQVVDPIAIRFDEAGRLWVVEMRDYPHGPAAGEPPRSQIRVLTDEDADGRFETSRVFADKLLFPTGIQPWKGGLFVTLAGEVAYLADSDGDGRADSRETWFRGFAQENPQLRANHPRLGLDGCIYVSNGLRGGDVVDARHADADARPLSISGRDFSFDPRTGEFAAASGNGQFGVTFDDFGNRFTCNNRCAVATCRAAGQVFATQSVLRRRLGRAGRGPAGRVFASLSPDRRLDYVQPARRAIHRGLRCRYLSRRPSRQRLLRQCLHL